MIPSSFKLYRQAGLALPELLVGVFILGTLTVSIVSLAVLGTRTAFVNEQRTVAQALANEDAERIRAIAYEDVGYAVCPQGQSECSPDGVLQPKEDAIRNGQKYTITRAITLVDDPFNGSVTPPLTEDNADYKQVYLIINLPTATTGQQSTAQQAVQLGLYAVPGGHVPPPPTEDPPPPTDDPPPTPTPTTSVTPTPTGSATPTPTGSPTSTPATSGTPTPTGSPTSTPATSGTPTPTGSPTSTPATSGTPTPTGSATPTPTTSVTPTPTGSATPTPTGSPTSTPATSGTPTPTGSATPTPTPSCPPITVQPGLNCPDPITINGCPSSHTYTWFEQVSVPIVPPVVTLPNGCELNIGPFFWCQAHIENLACPSPSPGAVWCDTDDDGLTNCMPSGEGEMIGGECTNDTIGGVYTEDPWGQPPRVQCCYSLDTGGCHAPNQACTAAAGGPGYCVQDTHTPNDPNALGCTYYKCVSSQWSFDHLINRIGQPQDIQTSYNNPGNVPNSPWQKTGPYSLKFTYGTDRQCGGTWTGSSGGAARGSVCTDRKKNVHLQINGQATKDNRTGQSGSVRIVGVDGAEASTGSDYTYPDPPNDGICAVADLKRCQKKPDGTCLLPNAAPLGIADAVLDPGCYQIEVWSQAIPDPIPAYDDPGKTGDGAYFEFDIQLTDAP